MWRKAQQSTEFSPNQGKTGWHSEWFYGPPAGSSMRLTWVIAGVRQHKSTVTQPLCQAGNKPVSQWIHLVSRADRKADGPASSATRRAESRMPTASQINNPQEWLWWSQQQRSDITQQITRPRINVGIHKCVIYLKAILANSNPAMEYMVNDPDHTVYWTTVPPADCFSDSLTDGAVRWLQGRHSVLQQNNMATVCPPSLSLSCPVRVYEGAVRGVIKILGSWLAASGVKG